MSGIIAYDLQPPARIPLPRLVKNKVTVAQISADATIRKIYYPADGTYPANARYWLEMKCDAMPHCHYCECGDKHTIELDEAAIKAIKGLLP
jgi:hypothetical protein